MKKTLRNTLLIISGIIVGLTVFVGYFFTNGKCVLKYSEDKHLVQLENWMMYLDNDTLITNVVIPGSHDSGTFGMLYAAECQTYTIKEQLNTGIRYFDIRINHTDKGDVFYHSFINGALCEPSFGEIEHFIKEHNTEFLILDFQHFIDSQDQVIGYIEKYLKKYVVINNTEEPDNIFISKLTVGDVRGKVIILFGENSQYCNENYIFSRNNDDCSYKNSCLNSFYKTELNGKKSEDYIENVIPSYIECEQIRIKEDGVKTLFVLQCQLTDTALIFGPYVKEKSHRENMSDYIIKLYDDPHFNNINIIMRDFVNEEKSLEIIYLNLYRDNVKFKDEFSKIYSGGTK